MAAESTEAGAGQEQRFVLKAFAILAAVALAQATAFLKGASGLDNDSLMRMAMVHDLIGGQGWFDPMQYRMGLEGGFAMHWSRLMDAPLAAISLAGATVTGSLAAGETIATFLWPTLLLVAAIWLVLSIATTMFGRDAFLPALVTGVVALASTGIFAPGAVDHHNLQVTLMMAMLAGLLRGTFRSASVAGCAAALMAAIGAEALPYVAAGGLLAGGLWLARGDEEADTASGFGIGFAATAAICFAATVPPAAWMRAACDAFSIAQASVAVLAGMGLALATVVARCRKWSIRLAALALLGASIAALVVTAFPQCLGDPYAGLDPRLRHLWLDAVVEAQPAGEILRRDPAMFAGWYATPLLALAVLIANAWKGGWRRAGLLIGALLAAAVLISLWQVRGALFAMPLAAIVLAGWIARARAAHASKGTAGALAAMAAAWVLSFGAIWSAAAGAIANLPEPDAQAGLAAPASPDCTAADYAVLAVLQPSTVLAPSNLGAPILRYTPHRTLAGPYHRNVAGNLAALDVLMAAPDEAERLVRSAGIGLVAICPGNSETGFLAEAAPAGLAARLAAGAAPDWLLPEPTQGALRIYRLR